MKNVDTQKGTRDVFSKVRLIVLYHKSMSIRVILKTLFDECVEHIR